MGWQNCHLHMFAVGPDSYGEPHPDDWKPLLDERKATLQKVASEPGNSIDYEYDFGDSWGHRIAEEKVMAPEPERTYPVCIDGKRACPPEDCGGVGGYKRLLETLADPSDPEHDQYVNWIGGRWDAEEFNLDTVNTLLLRVKSPRTTR